MGIVFDRDETAFETEMGQPKTFGLAPFLRARRCGLFCFLRHTSFAAFISSSLASTCILHSEKNNASGHFAKLARSRTKQNRRIDSFSAGTSSARSESARRAASERLFLRHLSDRHRYSSLSCLAVRAEQNSRSIRQRLGRGQLDRIRQVDRHAGEAIRIEGKGRALAIRECICRESRNAARRVSTCRSATCKGTLHSYFTRSEHC